MRISLPAKLMASYLLVAGLIVVPSVWFLRESLSSSLERSEAGELRGRVEAIRDRLVTVPEAQIDGVVREAASLLGLRVTYIDKSGTVLSDSHLPAERVAAMENHRDRPEVVAALMGGYGYSHRVSATLGVELIYGAVPLPATGAPRAVVRVASPASALHDAVRNALLALRLSSGVGISAAIGFSLFAALFVASPLRGMRDAARAFAQRRWVTVRRLATGDELEELSVALDELGHRLREQLVEVGAQETLLSQAVEAFPLPAIVLRPDLQPMVVNGAFRRFAGLSAANEGERLTELTQSPRFLAARAASEKSGLPTELALAPPGAADDQTVRGALVPLARPDAPSLWLLVADLEGPESEARGPEAVQRLLRSGEVILERLWDAQPALRPALAQLRLRLDEAVHAAGHPEAVGVEPVDASELLARCVDEMRALHPEAAAQLVVDAKASALGPWPQGKEGSSSVMVAESAGLVSRALRLFLGGALRGLLPGRSLEVTLSVEPTAVKVSLEGGAPSDLKAVRELARALGTDVGRVPNREREAAWLTLPRA